MFRPDFSKYACSSSMWQAGNSKTNDLSSCPAYGRRLPSDAGHSAGVRPPPFLTTSYSENRNVSQFAHMCWTLIDQLLHSRAALIPVKSVPSGFLSFIRLISMQGPVYQSTYSNVIDLRRPAIRLLVSPTPHLSAQILPPAGALNRFCCFQALFCC